MNDFQLEWCQNLLDKLMKKNISKPFHYQLSLFLSANLSDNQIKQDPNHNLTYISNQLSEGRYKSPLEFGIAVNQVLEDGYLNFKPNSILYNITDMLYKWFNKKIKFYPRLKQELWIDSLSHLQAKLEKLIESAPKTVKAPKPDLKPNSEHKHSEHKQSKHKHDKHKHQSSDLSDSS